MADVDVNFARGTPPVEVPSSPLLPTAPPRGETVGVGGGDNACYGAVEDCEGAEGHSRRRRSSICDRDVVNHAHPYSDIVVDAVALDDDASGHDQDTNAEVTYRSLIGGNENFRWYLASYLVTHAGEWFTYVASISAIEEIHAANGVTSRTSVSILVSLRLLPNALFTSIGGVLADSYDRRTTLWILDILGSAVAMLFLLAYYWRSIAALYMATVLQMTVAAIYEPNRSAIVPMLVGNEENLKKAVTLSGLAWSAMTAVGSSSGGFAAEWLGISACFWIDSLSYLLSASFIWKIKGKYHPTDSDLVGTNALSSDDKSCLSLSQFTRMTGEGLMYLRSKPWGPFVFLKLCAALVYGAADVLNVSFSERIYGDATDATAGSSQRLGTLFGFVGVGCFVGPMIVDRWTRMDEVSSLERACLFSFLLLAAGCFGMSRAEGFAWICAFSALRSAGSSVVWIYSSLLLQKFSSGCMLGRVMSVDYALATLSEALSAMCCGLLQDNVGLSAEQVSFIMSLVGLGTLMIWTIYLVAVRASCFGWINPGQPTE